MKSKILSLVLAFYFVLALSACSSGGNSPSPTLSPSPTPTTTTDSPDLPDSETIDKISVEMKLDATLLQAIVTIKNDSDYVFNGTIPVRFENNRGESCGDDIIFVEDLKPGNYTYARINLTSVSNNPALYYDFLSTSFEEGAPSSGGELNEDASAEITESFDIGFGGAGNPEYATSWYPSCVKIEIFNAENSAYATVTVKDDSTEEAISRIGNAIFGNYAKDYGLSKVTLITESGEEVFTREG